MRRCASAATQSGYTVGNEKQTARKLNAQLVGALGQRKLSSMEPLVLTLCYYFANWSTPCSQGVEG